MIIQGTNNPLIFTFSESMETIADIEISLYIDAADGSRELKHWTKDEVKIEDTQITAPIRQEESVKFPEGKCYIEVKWMNDGGRTEFAKTLTNQITKRNDKTIMEGAALD